MVNPLFECESSGLLTDLYQLTMAYGYWKTGKADQEAIFNLFFRKNPFSGNYVIASGLRFIIDYITTFSFTEYYGDYQTEYGLDYLKSLNLFDKEFLEYLKLLTLSVSIDAVPEGTFVFPNEPILRVRGPLLQCQLIETALLNIINFNSLIATKASRICSVADGKPVLEFGLRRAQGIDGALSASRAAYIGGCAATSNVSAGRLFEIPVKGTHAHSWVMSFTNELEAFRAYAKAMPNNCIFLVDTYDVRTGVMNAISVANELLKPNGYDLIGIRLDSGDMAKDSLMAKDMLLKAGFENTAIVASNDLDEYKISEICKGKHAIDAFGVGTNLITAKDDPALGGVYKLAALSNGTNFENKIKHAFNKTTLPGLLQVTRSIFQNSAVGDTIHFGHSTVEYSDLGKPLLHPVIENGLLTRTLESTIVAKYRTDKGKRMFSNLMDINNSVTYPVNIDKKVLDEQAMLVKKIERNLQL